MRTRKPVFASLWGGDFCPEDTQWFLFEDRNFIGADVHIDEIVAATQNLLKNPEEREVSVAVSRLRFPEGKDAQLIMWLRQL